MQEANAIVIVGAARTPQANLLGALKSASAPELGAAVIKAAIERAQLSSNDIQEVIMGCVLSAGLGQAPARQAALRAGLSATVPCTTINKMCGSGMKAVMLARDILLVEKEKIIVAGGMESMTNAPYLLPNARQGFRSGHTQCLDHMILDGLEDAYTKGRPMGYFADQYAEKAGFSRAEQDHFSMTSFERALKAMQEGNFKTEITPLTVKTRQGTSIIDTDEHPTSVSLERMSSLPATFRENGTVTAGNSSSIADGAAALVLMQSSHAEKRGIKPWATIIAHSSFAKTPDQFITAPIDAIRDLLKKIHWSVADVDLFEINEAFAVVTLAAMKELNIPREKLNIHGGGCALGHPIGATGARIIVTLIAALKKYGLKRGIASLCIAGGEATAIAIEI